MPVDQTAYDKNTREQYETLGRFVEAFEMLVNEVRFVCTAIMGPNPFSSAIPQIVFHHGAMTAKPLFEIMRAMIGELTSNPNYIDENEIPVFDGVLGYLAKEYNSLTNMRNNLLHGTWFVGYRGTGDEDAAEFYVKKHVSTKRGLKALDLPKTASELRALTQHCEKMRDYVSALQDCIPLVGNGSSMERRFKQSGEEWELRPYWQLAPSEQKREKARP